MKLVNDVRPGKSIRRDVTNRRLMRARKEKKTVTTAAAGCQRRLPADDLCPDSRTSRELFNCEPESRSPRVGRCSRVSFGRRNSLNKLEDTLHFRAGKLINIAVD